MRQHKLWLCTLLVLLLAALGAFGAAAETTVGMSGAGSFKMEQVYVNVPELDVYFYALDGDGNSYSPIKVQAAGPELTLGDRRLEVRSVAAASDPRPSSVRKLLSSLNISIILPYYIHHSYR